MTKRASVVLLVVCAAVAWQAALLTAQSDRGVPQQLAALGSMIEQLQSAVADIQEKLDGLAAPVSTDVFTGPLQRASNPASNFKCMALNASDDAATFTVRIRSQSGTVEAEQLCANFPAGSVCSVEAGPTPDQITYCQVSGLPAASVRVTHCAREAAVCVAFVTAP